MQSPMRFSALVFHYSTSRYTFGLRMAALVPANRINGWIAKEAMTVKGLHAQQRKVG